MRTSRKYSVEEYRRPYSPNLEWWEISHTWKLSSVIRSHWTYHSAAPESPADKITTSNEGHKDRVVVRVERRQKNMSRGRAQLSIGV